MHAACYDAAAPTEAMRHDGVVGSTTFPTACGFGGRLFAQRPDEEIGDICVRRVTTSCSTSGAQRTGCPHSHSHLPAVGSDLAAQEVRHVLLEEHGPSPSPRTPTL